jgi:hypothetical protein
VRKKIALAALGLGLAATFAPIGPASAYCDMNWRAVTGDCNPCNTIARVTHRPMTCLD